MSYDSVRNDMKLQAQMAVEQVAKSCSGIVTSYNDAAYSVKVLLQPSGIETGWIPIQSPWVGNGWGMYCPPSIGDQVTLEFEDGSQEVGRMSGALYSDEDKPLAVPSGEFWIVHKDGSAFKFLNGGEVQIAAGANLTVTVQGDANVNVQGACAATADSFRWTGSGTLDGDFTVTGKTTLQGDLAVSGISDLGGPGGSPVETVAGTATKAKAV